jgi:uncharacterized protein
MEDDSGDRRKLGDEWKHWKGDLTDTDKNADAGKRVFLGFLGLAIFGYGGAAFFLWYMIAPRLDQFHPSFSLYAALAVTFLFLLTLSWFGLIVLSIVTGRDYFLKLGRKRIPITSIVPGILKLGQRLGVPTDRMANSFIKVSNALIRSRKKSISPQDILILLPRCLSKSLLDQISGFSKDKGIQCRVVPGGELARKIIAETRPKAVIGVACERDLLSGIQAVVGKIPVIGIPNCRPEGPCMNTTIDMAELEKSVEFFTNS